MESLTLPPVHQSASIAITDDSGIGAARRLAMGWGAAIGFDDTRNGKLSLVVTEAASNALYHAREGEVLLRRLRSDTSEGIEVTVLDRGPGMRNVAECSVDGYSTRGTRGVGLGSIERNSDSLDVFSSPGRGTVLVARLWNTQHTGRPLAAFGAVCVPIRGEEVCGDGFGVVTTAERTRILLLDGLGHGQGAADATLAGLRTFYANPTLGPGELLRRLHDAMRSTRGAAAAAVDIEPGTQRLRFAGVGNCSGTIIDRQGGRSQGLASHNGTVGAQLSRVNEFSHPWSRDALLVVHSDGLATRWNLDDYPGLASRDPSLIAAVLYRDFSRHRDDVTVLAFKTHSA